MYPIHYFCSEKECDSNISLGLSKSEVDYLETSAADLEVNNDDCEINGNSLKVGLNQNTVTSNEYSGSLLPKNLLAEKADNSIIAQNQFVQVASQGAVRCLDKR